MSGCSWSNHLHPTVSPSSTSFSNSYVIDQVMLPLVSFSIVSWGYKSNVCGSEAPLKYNVMNPLDIAVSLKATKVHCTTTIPVRETLPFSCSRKVDDFNAASSLGSGTLFSTLIFTQSLDDEGWWQQRRPSFSFVILVMVMSLERLTSELTIAYSGGSSLPSIVKVIVYMVGPVHTHSSWTLLPSGTLEIMELSFVESKEHVPETQHISSSVYRATMKSICSTIVRIAYEAVVTRHFNAETGRKTSKVWRVLNTGDWNCCVLTVRTSEPRVAGYSFSIRAHWP